MECAGICLSKQECYGFEFGNQKCNLIHQSSTKIDIDTDNGAMTICLDHQNWSPVTVYVDNNNIPPICPSKFS